MKCIWEIPVNRAFGIDCYNSILRGSINAWTKAGGDESLVDLPVRMKHLKEF
ncbi:MAG: hypothetical protein GY774_10935 [Planctomycetes bacterium]|nr:hypothetical protein [Planctomycetota bacterium]